MNPEHWQKIKAIFYPALELPEDERLDYVKEKCGDDDALFEEIKVLLASSRKQYDVYRKARFCRFRTRQ